MSVTEPVTGRSSCGYARPRVTATRPKLRARAPIGAGLALVSASAWLSACNFEIPSSSYLVQTRLLGVTVEVIELGPLHPGRVGPPSPAAIAEPLPHDRVAFEALVFDRGGERLPEAEIDTLWFQCGRFDCGFGLQLPELFERDCEEAGGGLGPDGQEVGPPTMDSVCRLGRGDGRFEFVVPELGQQMAEFRVADYYGVVAWGSRSAASCWAARLAADHDLDNCAFIQRRVKIGPSWWMLLYAESIGLVSPIPPPQIPAPVLVQPANRVPIVSFTVAVDGQVQGSWPAQTQFTAVRDSQIVLRPEFDPATQLFQAYFLGSPVGGSEVESYLFTVAAEIPSHTAYTSGSIHVRESEFPGVPITEFFVDEYAEPGTARIILVYFDDRYGEGVARLDFEVSGGD